MSAGARLDVGPIVAWLKDLRNGMELHEVSKLTSLDGTYIRNLIEGQFETIALDVADRAFTSAGEPMALHYPLEDDEETLERHCLKCGEDVTTTADEICPWCDTKTVTREHVIRLGLECPRCGGEKAPGAAHCMSCRNTGNYRGPGTRTFSDEDYRCPDCGGRKSAPATSAA